ncbi:MAG: DUF1428 domain-containing protein [Pseudomonadota bacterium]|nr:DUF1428 domain-containing protein [Pseudomonadota bacterium]
MSYFEGFVAAVPTANKDAYRDHARQALPFFKELGATRMVETWGDDVPRGKINDFQGAVKATDDETVVFSWIEYPDKTTRDAANRKMMSDPRMQQMPEMPFDGKRMIFAGFEPILDVGSGRGSYVDGYVLAVPQANREAYRRLASEVADLFLEYGALRVVEAWGDDVPEGKTTDYRRAVLLEDSEKVVFSWVEWPSKQVRDEGSARMMEDERMKTPPSNMPFDGKRMIYGGFTSILDD